MSSNSLPAATPTLNRKVTLFVVGIGFTDLLELLRGTFKESPDSDDHGKPLKFIGYDSCEIVIARNAIMYEMMQDTKCSPESVLQVGEHVRSVHIFSRWSWRDFCHLMHSTEFKLLKTTHKTDCKNSKKVYAFKDLD